MIEPLLTQVYYAQVVRPLPESRPLSRDLLAMHHILAFLAKNCMTAWAHSSEVQRSTRSWHSRWFASCSVCFSTPRISCFENFRLWQHQQLLPSSILLAAAKRPPALCSGSVCNPCLPSVCNPCLPSVCNPCLPSICGHFVVPGISFGFPTPCSGSVCAPLRPVCLRSFPPPTVCLRSVLRALRRALDHGKK